MFRIVKNIIVKNIGNRQAISLQPLPTSLKYLLYSADLPGPAWRYQSLIEQMGREISLPFLFIKFRLQLRLKVKELGGLRLNIHLPLTNLPERLIAWLGGAHLQRKLRFLGNRLYIYNVSGLVQQQLLGPEDYLNDDMLEERWLKTAPARKAGSLAGQQMLYIPLHAKQKEIRPLLPPPFLLKEETPIRLYMRIMSGSALRTELELLLPVLLCNQQMADLEGWLVLTRLSSSCWPFLLNCWLCSFLGRSSPQIFYQQGPPELQLNLMQKGVSLLHASLLPLRAVGRTDRLPQLLLQPQQVFSIDRPGYDITLSTEQLSYPLNRLFIGRAQLQGHGQWLSQMLGFPVVSGGISWLFTNWQLKTTGRELALLNSHYRWGR